MDDLQKTLARNGFAVCKDVIRQAVRKAGYKWRSAKVVLTSTDPEYREKLERVQTVLADLGADERFFSIDEYGPFAVKAKAGRVLAAPGEHPSVPQWQKSKGWLASRLRRAVVFWTRRASAACSRSASRPPPVRQQLFGLCAARGPKGRSTPV